LNYLPQGVDYGGYGLVFDDVSTEYDQERVCTFHVEYQAF